MTRSLPEWIADNPDQKVPARVIVRVFEKAGKRCENCTRALRHRKDWELDHIKALKNGGEHRESNLQALCVGCHSQKTRADVAEKSKVAGTKKKHLGISTRKGPPMPGSRDSKYKKLMDGTVVLR